MSAELAISITTTAITHLCDRLGLLLFCGGLMACLTSVASAGCDFGYSNHEQHESISHAAPTYARHFRVLGQWVYERGQVKYVAWQAEGDCQGPNCSRNKEPLRNNSNMSLPQTTRTHFSAAQLPEGYHNIVPQIVYELLVNDAQPCTGYPSAYEYPP